MPRNTLKSLMPSPAKLRRSGALDVLGEWVEGETVGAMGGDGLRCASAAFAEEAFEAGERFGEAVRVAQATDK